MGFAESFRNWQSNIGAVGIRKSEISGHGLFGTKNIDAGTIVLVTKAIATERRLYVGGRDHIPLPGCALAMKQAQGYEAVVSAARVPKAAAFVAELKRSGGGAVESESNLSVYRRIPPVLGDHERSHQLIALTQILAFGYSFLDINIAPATSSAKFSLVTKSF
uniref:Uncharacterized protein n=1 Tax=Vitis vinifera TaxID=29760 RepID=A5B6G1_VITVI|nr:hypothetical protein VITISV_033030 [Vitis vinifera]